MNKIPVCLLLAMLFAINGVAVGPSVWSVNSRAEVLRGNARGVSIDDSGAITLASNLSSILKTDQSYIWSSAVDAAGNIYVGTGADGKIFQVNTSGRGWMFADLPELNVSAMAIGRGGELFAATSPDGKVYRVDSGGKFEVYFDPAQKYIWSLAVMPDGSLAVGTGENGRIYRVRAANADPAASIQFDASETHIISLATDPAGNLYAGTDPGGLVLRFGADGKPFALLDTTLREIHDLAVGPDGSVYALAISESASASAKPDGAASSTSDAKPAPTASPEPPARSRYDLSSARSAVYRILPDGGSDLLWASTNVTAFSLLARRSGVLIGTSDKGRIFDVSNDGRETLALQTDAGQISKIFAARNDLWAATSNQGVLYRISGDAVTEGSYESSVLDAKATASWGRIWWRSSGSVQIQTRSGNTEKPDETWSAWSAAAGSGPSGQVASPKARYLQWRAVLKNGAPAARLDEVNVAYLPSNIAPEVLSIQVLPTNVGLVPNPAVQIDPNIALSGLEPGAFGIVAANVAPRRVYQRGATSLQWTSEDRNGDKLVYDVYYKQVGDNTFRPFRENIDENFITVDGQSLADGRYIFKIVVKDSPSNPAGTALTGERTTGPFDIDNTAPLVTAQGQPAVTGRTVRVSFAAVDKASYITKAEYSINGGEWQTVYADDGISDSSEEHFSVQFPASDPGEYVVTLRVFDVNGNSGNARAVVRR